MRRSADALALLLVLVACSDKSSPPASSQPAPPISRQTSLATDTTSEPADPAVAASLKEEIRNLREQIASAEAESGRYTGGLVKALIESRIQTLKQTLTMLEQRDKAWTFGLRLQYTVDGRAFAVPVDTKQQLPQIENELRELSAKIQAQDAEVSRYSGGLIQAVGLSTLATMRQTEAMLHQRRLAIRYDLPQYLAFQSVNSPEAVSGIVAAPAATQAVTRSAPSGEDWEIVSVASRPGESNSSWTRFSWKLTISNKSAYPQKYDATIEFRDADGFPVDSDSEYGLMVPGNSQETFTGEKLITASQVTRIAATAAKVKKDS